MSQSKKRQGFTLVELLVVVIIIGILAALLIPTINAARGRAARARVSIEIAQLTSAIEIYKGKAGEDYPADCSDTADFQLHLARRFPRHNRAAITKWLASNPATQKPSNLDPAEAIVFWLSMIKNDALFPLTDSNGNNVALNATDKTFFEFKPERLKDRDGDGWPEYYPIGIDDLPFVYFDHSTYNKASYPLPLPAALSPVPPGNDPGPPPGVARPYAQSVTGAAVHTFFNPSKFQIVTSGFDLHYGRYDTVLAGPPPLFKIAPNPSVPAGLYIDRGDLDNLTNFSDGKTIEGMKP